LVPRRSSRHKSRKSQGHPAGARTRAGRGASPHAERPRGPRWGARLTPRAAGAPKPPASNHHTNDDQMKGEKKSGAAGRAGTPPPLCWCRRAVNTNTHWSARRWAGVGGLEWTSEAEDSRAPRKKQAEISQKNRSRASGPFRTRSRLAPHLHPHRSHCPRSGGCARAPIGESERARRRGRGDVACQVADTQHRPRPGQAG
jgi:hypothetical protein